MRRRWVPLFIAVYAALVVVLALVVVVSLFGDEVEQHHRLPWAGASPVNSDTRLLLIAAAMGAIGSAVHLLTSLATFVGNNTFHSRWTLWYVLRPWIGSLLALVFYFVLRGGLLTGNNDGINPFGIAAVGGMTGMFSKQAADKLNELFSTLFRVGGNGGDAKRADKLVPDFEVTEVLPPIVAQGKSGQILEIVGKGFDEHARVHVGDHVLAPERVEPCALRVTLPPEVVAANGELRVAVRSGAGVESAAQRLRVE